MPRIVNPAINRIAARLEPALRRAFERAIATLQRSIPLDAIEYALARADITPEILVALADLPNQLRPVGQVMQQVYRQAGQSEVGVLNGAFQATLRFDLTNPRAVTWAATESGRLIRQVGQTTREGVRAVIARAFTEGRAPRETAPLIRQMVGLTDRYGDAVFNYYDRLLDVGRTADEAAGLAQRYTRKLQRQRALLIARTETVASANSGQAESWQQASEAGLLDPDFTEREWIVSGDERTCMKTCVPLNGQRATLTNPFVLPDGRTFQRPPAHVACRCACGIAA